MKFTTDFITGQFKKIFLEGDYKGISVLSSGVIVAQAISFIAQPFVTRLYSPQEIGIIALLTSIITMFAPMLNWQYNLCIVSSPSDTEANNVALLAMIIGLIMSVILFGSILIIDYFNSKVFSELGNYIYVVFPLLVIIGITNVALYYNNRFGQYKIISNVTIYRTISSNILKIILGLFSAGVWGLIIALVVSYIAGIKYQSGLLLKNSRALLRVKYPELIFLLKKYKEQPLFSTPGVFVISYAYSIIPAFINSMYGIEQVGYFSLASTMLGLPIALLSSNMGIVFFRQASLEKKKYGNFSKSFKNFFILLISSSFIPFLVLQLFAESIFMNLFGQEWVRSGSFVKLLIPCYWFNFVSGALVIGFIVAGKQLVKLMIQLLFVVAVLIIYFAAKLNNVRIEEFLLAISWTYASIYLILLIITYYLSKK